ncbi:hypothetical protein JG687_00010834 [Phytophthora cactorum]|uniref:Uncharacterized protein n=1 Tax=Phytophthora cactorum TaxID=29920 RepID=A0A8T1UAU3_9STRA|nr:hypothetical protein JG687_00010834 [Phytophthora cactorum]
MIQIKIYPRMKMLSIKASYVPQQKLLNTFTTPILQCIEDIVLFRTTFTMVAMGDMYNPIVVPIGSNSVKFNDN